jgi:hypothetical protein
MDSPEMLEEARWNRLIWAVRGSGAAKVWFEFKKGNRRNPHPIMALKQMKPADLAPECLT